MDTHAVLNYSKLIKVYTQPPADLPIHQLIMYLRG